MNEFQGHVHTCETHLALTETSCLRRGNRCKNIALIVGLGHLGSAFEKGLFELDLNRLAHLRPHRPMSAIGKLQRERIFSGCQI